MSRTLQKGHFYIETAATLCGQCRKNELGTTSVRRIASQRRRYLTILNGLYNMYICKYIFIIQINVI